MEVENIGIVSKYDQLKLFASVYYPKIEPKAIVQVFHGLFVNRDYYKEFATILANYGYVVIVPDQRGHGDSIDENHPLGHFDNVNGWMMNMVDMNRFTQHIREKYRRLPCFMIGISLGSLVARSFLKRFEYEIDGLVLVSSPAYTSVKFKGIESIMKMSYRIKGPRYKSSRLDQMIFGGFDKLSDKENHLPFSWLTTNTSFIERFMHDPKTVNCYTSAFVSDYLFGYHDIFVYHDWNVLKKKLPILLLNGADDVCSQGHHGIKQTGQRLYEVGYTNIHTRVYDNCKHLLLQEDSRAVVYGDIISFLNRSLEEMKE